MTVSSPVVAQRLRLPENFPNIEMKGLFQQGEQRLKDLLVRGLGGDRNAYHAFLRDLGAHLRTFLAGRLRRSAADIEDVVQEALLAVHNQRHTYDPARPVTAWVHAIAKYKAVDFLRSGASRQAPAESLHEAVDLFYSADDARAEAIRDLGKLLQALPDRQRLPILHVKLHGFSVVEAARMTGLSESAVKVGVFRGMKALAARLRQRGQ